MTYVAFVSVASTCKMALLDLSPLLISHHQIYLVRALGLYGVDISCFIRTSASDAV